MPVPGDADCDSAPWNAAQIGKRFVQLSLYRNATVDLEHELSTIERHSSASHFPSRAIRHRRTGREAHRFADFLRDAGQRIWQVLPLGPTGYGDSPYQCFSAFAGNPLLLSLDTLVTARLPFAPMIWTDMPKVSARERGLRDADRLEAASAAQGRSAIPSKADSAERAPSKSSASVMPPGSTSSRSSWRSRKPTTTSCGRSGSRNWRCASPPRLTRRAAICRRRSNANKFIQFEFDRQWSELKAHCGRNRIRIMGDMPIYVAQDSSDVWAAPGMFDLNPDGTPRVIAGVPPDYFSATGQCWGNPIYRWDRACQDGLQVVDCALPPRL